MLQINCPFCGPRDEAEFTYRGDATVTRPAAGSNDPEAAFVTYVYDRKNPKGWHVEWWHHSSGCRQWLKVARHTVTNEIAAVACATDALTAPGGGA